MKNLSDLQVKSKVQESIKNEQKRTIIVSAK